MKLFTSPRAPEQDTCGGTCCPNGIAAVMAVQILLIIATVFSAMAMFDCRYVEADIGNTTFIPKDLVGITDGVPSERRGFGFYVHENDNDECRWQYWQQNSTFVNEEEEIENYIDTYTDWLGKDWKIGRVVGLFALAASVILVLWSWVYGCVAHVQPLRATSGLCSICIIATTQLVPLIVLNSDFCEDRDCTLNRSAIYSIISGGVFFFSGFLFFFMNDYPGRREGYYNNERDEETYSDQGHH